MPFDLVLKMIITFFPAIARILDNRPSNRKDELSCKKINPSGGMPVSRKDLAQI